MDINELMQEKLGSKRGVVTKSVVISELYDGENKSLHVLCSDMPIWDVVGMLKVVGEDATAFYVNLDPACDDEEHDHGEE